MTGGLVDPTEAGQFVRTVGRGGQVSTWMDTGLFVGFSSKGTPIVKVHGTSGNRGRTVYDKYRCFKRIDNQGRWVRQ